MSGGDWMAAAGAVARRPDLWATAVRQGGAMIPSRWWRRWPPFPVPPREYVEFRMKTAYGAPGIVPPAPDLVSYLEWCRRMRAGAR